MKILADILLLALGLAAAWWVSGHDSKLIGDNGRNDILRRSIRCGITFLLLTILLLLPRSLGSLPLLFAIGGMLAVTWAGCIAELFSQGFRHLIGFAGTNREFDPHESTHGMDALAELIRNGRHEEAAKLYETLKASGSGNVLAMETLLDRAGIPREKIERSNPLFEAGNLQRQGKFSEAEAILKPLLEKNPANVDAAMMLMRLYVRDLRQSGKAAEILRALEKQPHIDAAAIEYAQRSLHDWGRKKIEPKAEPLPESVEELLQAGYYGTAIEMLEQKAKEQPDDFAAQLKLAEAYGLHSGDLPRAKKIIEQMEQKSCFSEEQIRIAKAKLDEWREAKPKQ